MEKTETGPLISIQGLLAQKLQFWGGQNIFGTKNPILNDKKWYIGHVKCTTEVNNRS